MQHQNWVLKVTESGEASLFVGGVTSVPAYQKQIKADLALKLSSPDIIVFGNAYFQLKSKTVNVETGHITFKLEHIGGVLEAH
jgi:hypothetical protein